MSSFCTCSSTESQPHNQQRQQPGQLQGATACRMQREQEPELKGNTARNENESTPLMMLRMLHTHTHTCVAKEGKEQHSGGTLKESSRRVEVDMGLGRGRILYSLQVQMQAPNALMQIDWPQTFTNDSNRKKLLIVTTCWPWPTEKMACRAERREPAAGAA